jgi:hypothetical protein
MTRENRIGEFRDDDHTRFIGREWEGLNEGEKYERAKKAMHGIEAAAWPEFRKSCERTLAQQGLLSIALATEERLPGIKERMKRELGACESKMGTDRGSGKLQREYRKIREEQRLIWEAEDADRDPLVKAVKINKLIRLADHERKYRPEEFGEISGRAEELLAGSEKFANYRIFRRAFETVPERGKEGLPGGRDAAVAHEEQKRTEKGRERRKREEAGLGY